MIITSIINSTFITSMNTSLGSCNCSSFTDSRY